MKYGHFRWFNQCCLHPPTNIIDTSKLQFSRVTVQKIVPAANQSAACNQVINGDWICSIKLPIPSSTEDLQEALKADFLAVVILLCQVGIGRSSRSCWRSELAICKLMALRRSELTGSKLTSRWRSELNDSELAAAVRARIS